MSIQSAEDFDPTSSTPVFGSAVSQAKLQQQQQPTNDVGGSEKLVTPPQPVPNGQSEPANEKNGENLGNGTASSHHTNGGDAPENHVNGKHETSKDYDKPAEEAIPTSAVSDPVEKSSQNESSSTPSTEPVADLSSSTPAEPEPVLTTSAQAAKEDAPAATTADVAVAEPAAMETDVPAPKVAVPATPEPKTKVIRLFSPIDRFCMLLFSDILVTSRQT